MISRLNEMLHSNLFITVPTKFIYPSRDLDWFRTLHTRSNCQVDRPEKKRYNSYVIGNT